MDKIRLEKRNSSFKVQGVQEALFPNDLLYFFVFIIEAKSAKKEIIIA